jgi:uncharacterized membrane protein (DUF373 family)
VIRFFKRLWGDAGYLKAVDRYERQLAKVLGLVLLVLIAAASLQLAWHVFWSLMSPGTAWLNSRMMEVLGDLLSVLIALEVLQNITSYLRKQVIQIELVLLTAITAVSRKVIVLPHGAEAKPQLLAGLGVAVLALTASYWLVHSFNQQRSVATRQEPATGSPELDP